MNKNMDIDSFNSYCKKYKIPANTKKMILAAYKAQKPSLMQREPEYSWQKEGTWSFALTCDGKAVNIELGNWPSLNNVTFIGVEGMNV
jgi:hypothetical protein